MKSVCALFVCSSPLTTPNVPNTNTTNSLVYPSCVKLGFPSVESIYIYNYVRLLITSAFSSRIVSAIDDCILSNCSIFFERSSTRLVSTSVRVACMRASGDEDVDEGGS